MKLRNLLIAVVAMAGLVFSSCTKKEAAGTVENDTITVDALFAEAGTLLGDTVSVEGVCSHLCQHGGRKAFLVGEDSTLVLRCEATAEMGGAFAPDCVGRELKVTGVVCETRIDEDAVSAMEARQAALDSAAVAHEACDTEKKAQGQGEIDTFAERMADYRAKIAARNEAEGKAYLSFYYLEALSYEKAGE